MSLDTHGCFVSGERDCVRKAWALYMSADAEEIGARVKVRGENTLSMRCKRERAHTLLSQLHSTAPHSDIWVGIQST